MPLQMTAVAGLAGTRGKTTGCQGVLLAGVVYRPIASFCKFLDQ